MSGTLVGRVSRSAITDHNAYSVAIEIAEEMRHDNYVVRFTYEQLAARARMSVSSVQRGVRVLRDEGWAHVGTGNGKGVASTYLLVVDKLPKVVTQTTYEDSKGGHTDHLTDPKVVTQTGKVVTQTALSVSVGNPSTVATTDEHLPGVVAGVRIGPDETYVRTALETFGLHSPSDTTRRRLGALSDAGWLAVDVNAHLRANVDARACNDLGKVVGRRLGDLAATEPPRQAETATGPTCAVCSKTKDACRRVAAITDDPHPFTVAEPETAPRPSRAQGATKRPDAWQPPTAAERRHTAAVERIGTMFDPFASRPDNGKPPSKLELERQARAARQATG